MDIVDEVLVLMVDVDISDEVAVLVVVIFIIINNISLKLLATREPDYRTVILFA